MSSDSPKLSNAATEVWVGCVRMLNKYRERQMGMMDICANVLMLAVRIKALHRSRFQKMTSVRMHVQICK